MDRRQFVRCAGAATFSTLMKRDGLAAATTVPGAIERDRQFRLSPQQRKQRDNQSGAVRGKHRQHELDGVRQLNRDNGISRQTGFDEMSRQRRDRPIGFCEGQAFWAVARDTLLVGRVEQRQRIRLSRQDPPEQSIERR